MPEREAEVPRLPRLLCELSALAGSDATPDAGGAIWKLAEQERQLDANVVRLRPGHPVAAHDGPNLDVIMLVLAGSGAVSTEAGELVLGAGSMLWLPRRSRRAITPGPDGLTYLTVHPRRPKLQIGLRPG
jgi:quercetin dioxygenase-like cupin family protein